MGIAGCLPDDLRYCHISPGWHNVINSSGWVSSWQYLIRMTFGHHHISSGWLSRNWYIIRMSYNNVIMSSGWHTLPLLSHPDEIANFDFPQHAMALQRFRSAPVVTNLNKLYGNFTNSRETVTNGMTNRWVAPPIARPVTRQVRRRKSNSISFPALLTFSYTFHIEPPG